MTKEVDGVGWDKCEDVELVSVLDIGEGAKSKVTDLTISKVSFEDYTHVLWGQEVFLEM